MHLIGFNAVRVQFFSTIATLLMVLLFTAKNSEGQLPKRAGLEDMDVIIGNIKKTDQLIERQLKAEVKSDAVVFIPGALGSRLKDPRSGRIIWGESFCFGVVLSILDNLV